MTKSEAPWLEHAKKDLTLIEIPGKQAASRIKQMFFTVGHAEVISDEVSWCAAAVGTWLRETGYPTSTPIHLNLTGASYEHYGKACAPKKGAICTSTYTRLGRKDWRRHVGIILTDPRPGAKSYKVIGGNQADSVSVINVPIKKVTATRWPSGGEEKPAEGQPTIDLAELLGLELGDDYELVLEPESSVEEDAQFEVLSEIDDAPDEVEAVLPSTKFADCLRETLRWEGGYSNDRHDKGGATMRGITTARYRAYRLSERLHRRSVKEITEQELRAIYMMYYWAPVWGDSLPDGLDMAVFDFGVNSGPSRAIKYLQKALGVRADGEMGPITLRAIENSDVEETVKRVCDGRLAFVRTLETYWHFGRGWENRIKGLRRAALERAGSDDDPQDGVARPLVDVDKQSAEQGRADKPKKRLDAKAVGGIAAATSGAVGAASQTPIPAAPVEIAQDLSLWTQVAMGLQSFGSAFINNWEFFAAAGAIWALVSYGIPALYRKHRR